MRQAIELTARNEPRNPSRRAILAGVAGAVLAAGAGGFPAAVYAQSDITVDQFLALSERLTGANGLDAEIAHALLGGFLATGHGADLERLVKSDSSVPDLANAIVAAWYSGLYRGAGGEAVATYTDALLWTALTFTKPMGYCGGETGYWADPPET
jgi:Membrane bound FAD containing D-sorbitol dehydrogenase